MLIGILIFTSFFEFIFVNRVGLSNRSVKGTSIYLAQATCQPPVEGCGSSHYWDFSTCSCVYDGSCVEPVSGCGSDYYWDHTDCVCVPYESGGSSCQEPVTGCGTGFEWDSTACTCVYLGNCSEPSSGCGADHYWDSASCSCVYSGTTCSEPTGGCASNHYWDQPSCSCLYDGSCGSSAGSCTNGYYDYETCSCVYDCTEPAGGCGAGFFWDANKCYCAPESGTNCYEPIGGCGTDWYWDYELCECVSNTSGSSTDTTFTPTPTTVTYTETNSTFDRLAYESETIIGCIKDKLTSSEYQTFRYKIADSETERQYIQTLSEKIRFCWTQHVDLSNDSPQEALSSTRNTIENESCLIRVIGEAAYKDIYQGLREPTDRERLAFKGCYETKTYRKVTYKTDEEEIDDTVHQCLKTSLGDAVYTKVVDGQSQPTSVQLKKINACFGVVAQPFDEGSTYKAPDKVVACLQSALGKTVFSQINSGKRVPTTQEREKSKACFNGVNPLQKKFLPPPVEEVPFLDEEPGLVKVAVANQVKKKVKNKEVGGAVVLSGNGPPNSTVNIYIYSDPIVVTTETDENGDWVYELKNPIDGEKHIAYATVRNSEGRVVRSSVFDFTVVAADTDSVQALLDESKSSDAQKKFVKSATIMVAIASLVVIIIGIIVYLKNAKLLKEAAEKASGQSAGVTSDGKSEGESGSGPVN